MLKETRI